jgi:hypothetical protein
MSEDGQDKPPEPPVRLRARLDPQDHARIAAKAARRVLAAKEGGRRKVAQCGWPDGYRRLPMDQLNAARARAPRCTAEKRDGTRCPLPVVRGSDRCQFHEGVERAPHSPAAAKRYLAGTLRPPRGRFRTHPSALLAPPPGTPETD